MMAAALCVRSDVVHDYPCASSMNERVEEDRYYAQFSVSKNTYLVSMKSFPKRPRF